MKLWWHRKSNSHRAWKIVGSIVAAAVVTGIAVNFPDIKRYIRISTM